MLTEEEKKLRAEIKEAEKERRKEAKRKRKEDIAKMNKLHSEAKIQNTIFKRNKKIREKSREMALSEGIGVYIAVFPSGIYVGSGQIWSRRTSHTSGYSHVAKRVGEKAIDFIVVDKFDCLDSCRELEQLLIDLHGLDNLLNTSSVVVKHYKD